MTIRKATYNDIKVILSHSMEVLRESTNERITPTQRNADKMVSPFMADGGSYLIYIENDEIKGWIGIGSIFDYYLEKVIGYISELYVMPLYRGHGIAEKLCKEALTKLREEGYTNVQLNVFSGNQAKKLYKKLGFQEVSTLLEIDLNK
ncbi:GNAT family N-acetyltransferase [Oceanobacillus bengalensis]|uniref:GNAT family N-acetyltransferase n=1 Tax=Oceanobacillus bengalensis TaxID=1435466 RepID=A0A494YV19_9BACI|nr:GNAT family N-acetyltransferase [Oceanobacillus bengalensis]RKQ14027.1 GNAT family N-acetyltransferase [Oceanobacillus bengalensis]